MKTTEIEQIIETKDNILQLSPIALNEDYRKKWNIHYSNFFHLSKNGEPIRNALYRLGGLGHIEDIKKDYFLLLKYVEAHYFDDITKVKKDKLYLEGRWCILDKNGVEKVEFGPYMNPYLIGGVIYSIDNEYYNIETGEKYCSRGSSIKSADYIFIENNYDKDESKRGVMKINKKDGSFEVFY